MKLKLNITAAIFIIIFAALLSRVAYFKICYGNEYETRSKLQSLGGFDKTIPARRGEILDRNSVKLAVSVPVYNLSLLQFHNQTTKNKSKYLIYLRKHCH